MVNLSLAFGTDGVRGKVGTELTSSMVKSLGLAAAPHLNSDQIVIGRDTRESGNSFEEALAQGFNEGGVEPILLGVTPTPAVAHIASTQEIAGAMVSASHNPWWDNGIKLFASGGYKLDDVEQKKIEETWHKNLLADISEAKKFRSVSSNSWTEAVKNSVDSMAFNGIKIALDCANGSMSEYAPEIMRQLGAQVEVLNASPNGRNINEKCGATDLNSLQEFVTHVSANVGFAFDGDGDRVIAVSSEGKVLDGDYLLALIAVDRLERGQLNDNTVVITVMANLGLRKALTQKGINLYETPVGDRYVLEALQNNKWDLGGEQSGHIVISDFSTTGDGLLTAVQALAASQRRKTEIGSWANELVQKSPQILINLPISKPGAYLVSEAAELIDEMKEKLGENGRILVRPSGTEPLIRIMVEAFDERIAQDVANSLELGISALDDIA